MDVALRAEEPGGGDGELFGVWIDGTRRAGVTVAHEALVPSVSIAADEPYRWTRDEIRGVVRATASHMATSFEFRLSDPLFRYEARSIGFSGGLRAPLAPWGASAGASVAPGDASALAEAVNALLGRTAVRAGRPPRSAVGRLANRAASGNVVPLFLAVTPREGREFSVVVPHSRELLVEVVALAIDTALGVCRRLPDELKPLESIAFDRSDVRFVRGKRRAAGMAHRSLARIHLNASYSSPDGLCAARLFRAEHPPPRPPAQPKPPATFIDGVVAHELWHVAEGVFQGKRYPDSIAFRRSLGLVLGVATLEHAVRPRPEDGAAGKTALATLRSDVSAYATTNIAEAMAELFAVWWWAPAPLPPVVARFGELLSTFFPGPGSTRRGLN